MGYQLKGCTPKQRGDLFEQAIVVQARAQGIWAKHQGMSARKIGFNKIVPVKSDLDFKLITRSGRVAFIDAKTFEESYFTYSELNPDQVKKAVEYNEWAIPSGFVVWLRKNNEVFYYPGNLVDQLGKGTRFSSINGVHLGYFEDFKIRDVFDYYALA